MEAVEAPWGPMEAYLRATRPICGICLIESYFIGNHVLPHTGIHIFSVYKPGSVCRIP